MKRKLMMIVVLCTIGFGCCGCFEQTFRGVGKTLQGAGSIVSGLGEDLSSSIDAHEAHTKNK